MRLPRSYRGSRAWYVYESSTRCSGDATLFKDSSIHQLANGLPCGVMYADETRSNRRLTVKQAAERLNTTEAAIRQRIQRESIAYEKDHDTGRVYIVLDGTEERLDGDNTAIQHGSERELIDTLQEQLRLERESSAELRRILAAMTQRIPAIEAAPDERESPVTVSEPRSGNPTHHDEERPQERTSSWWRRFFGFQG